MQWERRRDLEGGKQRGIWLLRDETGVVQKEVYVESHEYRGDGFDVHEVIDATWDKKGEFDDAASAFEFALAFLADSPHPTPDI